MLPTKEDIEFYRTTLKAVSPHYPGFLQPEVAKGIDSVCDAALKASKAEQLAKAVREFAIPDMEWSMRNQPAFPDKGKNLSSLKEALKVYEEKS